MKRRPEGTAEEEPLAINVSSELVAGFTCSHVCSSAIIVRHWSNTIGRKLGSSRSSQHGSDSSDSEELEDVAEPKDNTIKVIVNDSLEFITAGIETIIEDDVTNRFKAAHIASWNFLTRTQASYIHIKLA